MRILDRLIGHHADARIQQRFQQSSIARDLRKPAQNLAAPQQGKLGRLNLLHLGDDVAGVNARRIDNNFSVGVTILIIAKTSQQARTGFNANGMPQLGKRFHFRRRQTNAHLARFDFFGNADGCHCSRL